MRTLLTASALTAVITIASIADAMAWERKGSRVGPRGTSTFETSGNCDGGSCSRTVSRTGPRGYTTTRDGNASCSGGSCSGSRITTLPSGEMITREGSITR